MGRRAGSPGREQRPGVRPYRCWTRHLFLMIVENPYFTGFPWLTAFGDDLQGKCRLAGPKQYQAVSRAAPSMLAAARCMPLRCTANTSRIQRYPKGRTAGQHQISASATVDNAPWRPRANRLAVPRDNWLLG